MKACFSWADPENFIREGSVNVSSHQRITQGFVPVILMKLIVTCDFQRGQGPDTLPLRPLDPPVRSVWYVNETLMTLYDSTVGF